MSRQELISRGLPVVLFVLVASPAGAQSFRVQCPTSTITHPNAATNNAEPAYLGPTKLALGSGGYLVPDLRQAAPDVNGAVKCQQISGGDGFASVTVDASGNVKLSGTLGDGTRMTQKAILSGQSEWPFFVPLYSGQGSALGWLAFTNETSSDFRGAVTWIKLSQPASAFYPAGFTNELDAIGSLYRFTNGVPVLDVSTGQVSLVNGNLVDGVTNVVALSAANKVSNLSSNQLTLTISASSGLFKGSVTDPSSGRVIPLNGAILQKINAGRGFFPGTNQTGRVFFGP